MKAFTWSCGNVVEGIDMIKDEKLGQVIFLGETGRGRRFEKVAIGRHRPAEVVDGKVFFVHPIKITLPERNGKPEFSFYVLEKEQKEEENILVRVRTLTSYVRGACGHHKVVEGEPEVLKSGYGAFGAAGRVGSWDDSLVVMKPGDVLRVYPSRGQYSYAFWIEDGKPVTVTWKDYQGILAVEKAEIMMVEAETNPESLDIVYASMKAFTFQGGNISEGIKITDGATGSVVALGEKGRGRVLTEIPLVGLDVDKKIEKASVIKLEEKEIPVRYSWEEPTVKVIYGLTRTDKDEQDSFLVHICTGRGYTRRGNGSWKLWKGNSKVLAQGNGADGDAGGIGTWDDGLFVFREGDVVYVRPSGDGPSYALFVKDGRLQSEPWISWKIEDAKKDPDFYVARGTAPNGHIPSDWIGRVVSVDVMGERRMRGGSMIPTYSETETGELISVDPLILNLGWDGRDYHEKTIQGLWLRLKKDKKVNRLEGDKLEKRQQVRTEAEELRLEAISLTEQSFFKLDPDWRVENIAEKQNLDTMPTEGWQSLTEWIQQSKKIIEEFKEKSKELVSLEERQNSGDILVSFEAWHRRGGYSNNGDGWVIQSNGSLRERDSDNVRRHKSDDTYHWNMIKEDELALKWSCGTMRDIAGSSQFEVVKFPVDGITDAQLEAVRQIELEDIGTAENSFGLDSEAEQRQHELVFEIVEKFPTCPACGQAVVYDHNAYLSLTGEYGLCICNGDDISRLIDWNKDFDQSTEGRSAQVVVSREVFSGVVEALAYEKWGTWNLNLRWRKFAEEEIVEESILETVSGEDRKAPTADSMASLLAKFGK